MEISLKNFRLIETFSNQLSVYLQVPSNLQYTIKSANKSDLARAKRLTHEVQLLRSCKVFHKNIISVISFKDDLSFQHTLFEPCPEGPLSSCSKLDPFGNFIGICQGVKYLHKRSIVLKTLSVDTILLKGHTPKISSFEWAGQEIDPKAREFSDVQIENYWKAPEVLESNGHYTTKSDIWNLGLIFFFLLFRQQYQSVIPETKPSYKQILLMTLDPNPNTRWSIDQVLEAINQNMVQSPQPIEGCSCFTPRFLVSGKSTKTIVRNLLRNDLKQTNDKNLMRLIRKVETSPEKISKFFSELQKQSRITNGIVRIRALSVLFAYLQRAPLLAYAQEPDVYSLILSISQQNRGFPVNEQLDEVAEGLVRVLVNKYYVVKQHLPNVTGNFNKGLNKDFVDSPGSIIFYWENLQLFLAYLLECRVESRVLRLWIDEEQINIFQLLCQAKQQVVEAFDERLRKLQQGARELFEQDNLKFPVLAELSEKGPDKIKGEEKKVDGSGGSNGNKDVKEENFDTLYKTANSKELQFSKIDLDSPEDSCKSGIGGVSQSKLVFKQLIGTGTSCEVWLGSYYSNKVAIKKQKSSDKISNTEFKRELDVLQSFQHPNLVNCIGAVYSFPQCLILEYCAGGDLFKLLHKRKDVNLSWPQRLKILKDVCQGMDYLHQNSFIHRDLKSLNLLLSTPINTPSDPVHIKISDFGLTRKYTEDDFMTGRLGTCHWMAPEILKSSKYTLKADVYSFAIVIYETITREYPYKGKRQEEISRQVVNDNLRPEIEFLPEGCPLTLVSLMKMCWNSNDSIRPSFSNILKILDSIEVGS